MGKTEIVPSPMTKAHAQSLVNGIREKIGDVGEMLVELRDRLGWHELGYKSWDACVAKEFPWTRKHANMLLATAQLQKAIAPPSGQKVEPIGSTFSPIPTTHIEPLLRLPEDQRAAVYQDVVEEAHGAPVTAKDVKEKVKLYQAADESYKPPVEAEKAAEEKEPENPLKPIRTAILACKRQVEGVATDPQAWALPVEAVKIALHRAARMVFDAIAEHACPRCQGKGCDFCGPDATVPKSKLDEEPATEPQVALLTKLNEPTDLPKAEASRIITAHAVAEQWRVK